MPIVCAKLPIVCAKLPIGRMGTLPNGKWRNCQKWETWRLAKWQKENRLVPKLPNVSTKMPGKIRGGGGGGGGKPIGKMERLPNVCEKLPHGKMARTGKCTHTHRFISKQSATKHEFPSNRLSLYLHLSDKTGRLAL